MFFSSIFNQDISQWDVSKVTNMSYMFERSKFNQDISEWDVSKVINTEEMFAYSQFNQNIDSWTINQQHYSCRDMFYKSKMEELPTWYK